MFWVIYPEWWFSGEKIVWVSGYAEFSWMLGYCLQIGQDCFLPSHFLLYIHLICRHMCHASWEPTRIGYKTVCLLDAAVICRQGAHYAYVESCPISIICSVGVESCVYSMARLHTSSHCWLLAAAAQKAPSRISIRWSMDCKHVLTDVKWMVIVCFSFCFYS
jgi:hypothetical protein